MALDSARLGFDGVEANHHDQKARWEAPLTARLVNSSVSFDPSIAENMVIEMNKISETQKDRVELREAATGYLQVWPKIDATERTNYYRDDFYTPAHFEKAERESEYWRETWDLRRGLIERALGATEPNRKLRILDVGCSGGFFLEGFRSGGWSTIGVEPSEMAVEYARSRFQLDVHCCSLEELELTEPVDAVHCSLVLEHLADPELAIEQMSSLLRPGGILFVEVPNDFNPLQLAIRDQLKKDAWWVAPHHHVNYFTFDSLSKLLSSKNFEELDRLASFPMELFVLMGEDYVGNKELGLDCHKKRMRLERNIVAAGAGETLNDMYRALAKAGLGRTCGLLTRKTIAK